ncbi:hypothetical protein C1S82_00975 [Mycolicibacterium cosmeticum]|uniref:Uncharacterized protein n=2 Tax=Mycolicibacterium cosmeticum TaxID=258533 RepID=W9B6H4_MYCCO|nr:hypothetical protein C1S82_00975 [Mycolicibacterium cosmeticum]CDO10577.1 hypothetical protein BN977_05410 [Mycolicibacterium cosmeticum]
MAAGAVALSVFLLAGGTTTALAGARPGDPGGHVGQDRDAPRAERGGGGGNGGAPGRTRPDTVSRAPQAVVGSGRSPSIAGALKPPAGSSGSRSPATAPAFVAPKVTFGNGRHPEPAPDIPTGPAPQPVAVPPPVAVVPQPAPLGILQPPTRPSAPVDLSALHAWDNTRPGQPWTSWFGLAGLLLIPLAGAALGYRQARAAKAAAGLVVR